MFALVDVDSDGTLSWDEIFKADVLAIVRQYPHVMPGLEEQDIAELREMLLRGEEGTDGEGAGEGDEEGAWEEDVEGAGDIQEEEGWENVKEEL